MKEKKCGIYKIENIINNKIYIGSSIDIDERWRRHIKYLNDNKHHSPNLQYSWNKYGSKNFKFEVIELCSLDVLISREQFYLNTILDACNIKSKIFKKNGYNVCRIAGNTQGFKFSEISKEKLSNLKSKNGKLLNIDFSNYSIIYKQKEKINVKNKNINSPFYGKKHTKQSKQMMSIKKSGNKNLYYGKGPMLGKNHTKETKDKISESNKGKNNKNSKIVYQYDLNDKLIKTWDSVGLLCKILKLSVGNISMCCLGKRKTAYGFKWKYD
jgi:group I intron endonuclease